MAPRTTSNVTIDWARRRRILFVAAASIALAANNRCEAGTWTLKSPASRLEVKVHSGDHVTYSVHLRSEEVVTPSQIDLNVTNVGWVAQGEPQSSERSAAETLNFVVPRKFKRLDVKYNELTLKFPKGALVFRAYDEAVAYRWETSIDGEITVEDERAEFHFPDGATSWFPEEESIFTHQERNYKHVALADVTPERFCSTGVLIEMANNRKVYISESDLRSYPGMFLRGVGGGKAGLAGKFAPFAVETGIKDNDERNVPVTKDAGYLAKTDGARTYPWRVMLVTENDAELLKSEIIYALASPQEIDDASWIKPGKVAWEWWSDINVTGVDFRVGVNTNTYKYYIDFASEFGIPYVLLDEGWCADSRDVLSVSPNLDLEELVRYAKTKNVRIILWVLWNALDAKLEPALTKFENLGIAGIKVDFMQRDDQWMIDYYRRIASSAAKHHLMVDFHGACKPTGLCRAFPNVMTSEGVTGMEQYKWGDVNNNPEQELVLPFVRMVAGPMDFTPGALNNANKASWRWNIGHPMSQGTRCHQLAMFVVYESPLQMLCDSPSRYRKETDTMRFLSAAPTVWDDTVPIAAKVSDYALIARRSGENWFVGAMTDWDGRELALPLDFLPSGSYQLESWSDGINADRDGTDLTYQTREVSAGDKLTLKLAPGGGWVGTLRPVK